MKKNVVIITAIIIVLVLGALVALNVKPEKKQTVKSDAIKFKEEYESLNNKGDKFVNVSIDEDNPFVYSSYKEIKSILEGKTGVIFFGFPECPWCRNMVSILADVANEFQVKKIYYLNNLKERDNKKLVDGEIITEKEATDEYNDLVKMLYDHLPAYKGLNDETIKRIYYPTVVFVKKGEIVGLHVATVDSQDDPYNVLNDEQTKELKGIYSKYIAKTYDIACDEAC